MTTEELDHKIKLVKGMAFLAATTSGEIQRLTARQIIKLVNEINEYLDKEDKFLCAVCFEIGPVDRMEMQIGRIHYEQLKPNMPVNETAFMCDNCSKIHEKYLKQNGYI